MDKAPSCVRVVRVRLALASSTSAASAVDTSVTLVDASSSTPRIPPAVANLVIDPMSPNRLRGLTWLCAPAPTADTVTTSVGAVDVTSTL
jgi:hypothetical protein